ncbi:hypothetical protein FACS1894200_11810 [Spirochaetia bacterium]|nr:hypothetical protein FACS1894200_11810 [Spirochaetia bacterium]
MAIADDVAKYIINTSPVDNLKLQKLLYYSQAVYLVQNGKEPLFMDSIEAWDYGPVVPPIYQRYKGYGLDTIPASPSPLNLNEKELESVDMTLAYYGEMSGLALMSKTHQELPWKESYKQGHPGHVISIDLIYDYFSKALEFTAEVFSDCENGP